MTQWITETFASAQRPIQRTIEQLRCHGPELSRGTIASGLQTIEPLLEPIDAALQKRNRASGCHQADAGAVVSIRGKTGSSD